MGYGMMCRTTPKWVVVQGGANHLEPGAAPPPPPTGAVGGGVALHPSAAVVVQVPPIGGRFAPWLFSVEKPRAREAARPGGTQGGGNH